MAIKDIVKVNRKTFFDPRAWLGYDTIKEQSLLVWDIVKQSFVTVAVPAVQETFEEARARLNLSDADMKATEENYLLFAFIFLITGIFLFCFSIYLLFTAAFAGFLISLSLAVLLASQAFRNHFLYFQIKHRKLGCTLNEWRQGRVNVKDEGSS